MEELFAKFVSMAFDASVLLAAAAIYGAIRATHRLGVASHPVFRRALPILPEVLGVAAVVSGAVPIAAALPVGGKVAFGLWTGYLAGKFHKILGQTILGDDRAIERRVKKEKEPGS